MAAADLTTAVGPFSAATVVEANGNVGALPLEIKPLDQSFKVWGPALTVATPAGDNLWIHRALAVAHPGDVLVVAVGAGPPYGYWGEILSQAARAGRVGGVVLDGCARDGERLAAAGVAVFSRGLCIRGTAKDADGAGSVGRNVTIGEVVVHSGDLVVGDADGVVVVSADRVDYVVATAESRDRKEATVMEELATGRTTVDIYSLGRGDA